MPLEPRSCDVDSVVPALRHGRPPREAAVDGCVGGGRGPAELIQHVFVCCYAHARRCVLELPGSPCGHNIGPRSWGSMVYLCIIAGRVRGVPRAIIRGKRRRVVGCGITGRIIAFCARDALAFSSIPPCLSEFRSLPLSPSPRLSAYALVLHGRRPRTLAPSLAYPPPHRPSQSR